MALTKQDFDFGFALITTLAEEINELGYRGVIIRRDIEDVRVGRIGAITVSRRPHRVIIEIGTDVVTITTKKPRFVDASVEVESYDLSGDESIMRIFAVLKDVFG